MYVYVYVYVYVHVYVYVYVSVYIYIYIYIYHILNIRENHMEIFLIIGTQLCKTYNQLCIYSYQQEQLCVAIAWEYDASIFGEMVRGTLQSGWFCILMDNYS